MGKHPCLNILKGNKHLEEAFKNIDENLSEAEQRVQILETAKKYHKQLFTDLNELKQKAGENLKPSQKKYVEQDRTKEIEAIKKEYQQKIDSLSKPVAENVEGKKADIERRRQEDFQNENESYRVIVGDEAFNDIVESGVVRTNANNKGGQTLAEKLAKRPTLYPSFSKGRASMEYANANPNNYIIVTEDSSIQPSTSGRHGKGTTMFPTDENGKHLTELSGGKIKVYKHIGNGEYILVYANGKQINAKYDAELEQLKTEEDANNQIQQQEEKAAEEQDNDIEAKKADIERRRQENPSVERGVLINYESGKTKEQLIDIVNKLKNGEINLNEIIKEFFNLPINTLSEVKEAFKEGTLADKIQFGLDTNELSDLQPKTRSRESIINAKQKALFQKQKTEEALKDSEYKTVKKTDPITGKVTETKVKRTAEEKTKYDDFHKKALEDVNKEIEKYDAELKELENNNPTLPTNETEQTTVAGEQSVSTDVEVKKATISINGRDTTYTQNDQGEWVSPNGAVAKGNNLKKIEAQIQQNQPSQQSTEKTERTTVSKLETKEPSQNTKETIVKVKLGDKLVKGEIVLWNGTKHEVVKQNSDGTFNIKDSNGKVIKEVMANDKEFGGKVIIESNNLQKVPKNDTLRKNSLSQDQKTELSKIIEVHDEEVNPTSDLVEQLRSHESDQVKDLVKTYDKADKSTKESREAANDAFEKGVRDLIVNDRQKLSQEELSQASNVIKDLNKDDGNKTQQVSTGKDSKGQSNLSKATAFINRADASRSEDETGRQRDETDIRAREDEALILFAEKTGLLVDVNEVVSEKDKFDGGAEQQVYKKDGKTVTKVNTGEMNNTRKELLNRIETHNKLFPDTPYVLVGIAKNAGKNGDQVALILEQPYVQGQGATQQEIQEDLEKQGFKRIDDPKSGEVGGTFQKGNVIIDDVFKKDGEAPNVIKGKDGTLFYIDPNIKTLSESTTSEDVESPIEKSESENVKGWKNLFKPKQATQQPAPKSKSKTSTAKEPQGKLLTEKGFNAVGKGQTRLSSVAEQTKRSDPNFNRLVDIIKKLIPSLLASDIKLYVYPSKEAMAKAMEQKGYTYENESAFFDNNEIHLDLSSASSEVPIHEIIHPILNKILENSPELYKSLANQVKHLLTQGDKDALKAQGFSENYKGESQKMDEMVVQYLANKVANEIQLGNTNTSLIKGFVKGIKAILGKLGIFSYGNILSKDLSTLESFTKNLAEGIENGFKIQESNTRGKQAAIIGENAKVNTIQASRHNPITRSYKDLVITLRAIEEQYKDEMPSKDELKAYALELGYDANEFDEAYADFRSVQKNISQHLRQFSEVTEAAFQDDLKRKTFEQALERGLRKIPNLLDHPASLEENVLVLAQKYLNGDTDVNIDEDYAALLSMTASNILSNINQFNEQLNGLSGSANSNEELYRTIMQQVSNASVRYEVIASALIKTGREAARVLAYRKELLFKQEIEARREELQALLNKTDKESNKKEIQELIKMNEYLAKQGLNLDSLLQSLVDGTLAITKTRATEMVKALSKTPTKSVKAKIEALKRYSQTGSFKQASRDTPINEASEEEIRQMNMDRRRIIHDLTSIVAAELPQDKLDLAELAKKMNEFVVENELNQGEHPITEVTESELIDTLSQSHPDSKKQVLSEGAKTAKELRRQAALVDKIQKLLNGEFSPNPKIKKREVSNRTQDLINLVDNLTKAFDKNNLTEEDKVTLQNLIANLNLAEHLGITDPAEIAFDEAKQAFSELMDNTRLSKLQKEAEQLEKDLAVLASSTGGDLETAIEDIRNKQKGKAQTYKSKKTEEALAKNIAMRKQLKEAVRDKNKEALEELAKLEKQAEDLEKDLHLLRDKKEVVSSEQIDALFKKYYKPASPAKGVAIQRQMQHNIGIRANIKKRLEDYEKSNSDSKWVRGAHKLSKGVDKLNNLLNSLLLAFDMSVYGTFTALSMYRVFTDPVTRETFFQNLKHAGNAWSKLAANHDTEEFKAYQEANKQTVENPDGTTDELVPTFADFVNHQFDEFIAANGITEDQLHEWGVKRPFDFAKEDDLSMFRNFATNEKTRLTAALARSNAALALYRSQLMALDNKRWNDANPNATPEERKRYAEHVNWMYFSPKVTTFSGAAWRFLTLAPRYKLAIFRNLLASPFYLLGALGDVTGISPDAVAKSIAAKYIFPFLVTATLYGIALAMIGGYDLEKDWTDKNFLKLVKYVKNGEGLTDEKDPLFIFGPALRFILSFIHITNYSLGTGSAEYQAKLGDRFGEAMTREGSPVAVFMNEIQRWMGVAPQFMLESASGSDFGGKRRYDLKEPENPRLKAYAKAALEHFSPLPLQSALPPDGNWNVPLRHPKHYITNLMANSLGIKSKFDYRKSYDPKIKNWLSETGIKLDINPKGKNTNPLEWVFKTQNNNPLRDDLRERVTIRLNIWFNEEMEGDIDKATSIAGTKNKKPITEIQKKFEEIAAEERKAIYTEQEEMGEGRVKDILHRYTKITTKSLEEYKKQAEEYEDEK